MVSKGRWSWLALTFGAMLVSISAQAQAGGSLDEARSGWQYRRTVAIPEATGLTTLALPPEVRAKSASELNDLRLVDEQSGRELPYVIEQQTPIHEERREHGTIVDMRTDRHVETTWLVDLGKQRTFATFSFDIAEADFTKRLKIEAAANREGPYQLIAAEVAIFDRLWPWYGLWRIHHTQIELNSAVSARFLRITADDHFWAPIVLGGVTVHIQRTVPGVRWAREVGLVEVPLEKDGGGKHKPSGRTRYKLQLPPGLPSGVPIEEIELKADDPVFARKVTALEMASTAAGSSSSESELELKSLGEGFVFRFFPFLPPRKKLSEAVPTGKDAETNGLPAEERTLRLERRPGAGAVFIDVDNGDSPPLHNLRAVISGTATRLLFPLIAGSGSGRGGMVLYYGNPRARQPQYDLESLRGRMMGFDGLPLATLGPEQPNPRFRPLPPLSFVTGLGAELDSRGHRGERSLIFRPGAGEDIYGFSLLAEDLGMLKPDFSDLRIIDSNDRQVPYVLSESMSERSLAMEARANSAGAAGTGGAGAGRAGRITRYELTLPATLRTATEQTMPVAAIDLEIKAAFFRRPARVLAPPQSEPSERAQPHEREIWSGELARQLPGGGSVELSPEEADLPVVMRIVLPSGSGSFKSLAVEIDNQDNAPLNIAKVSAVVVVPRVAFKLKPDGAYRVLYGSREAEAPHYDIELLRRAVLDYAALPVEISGMAENPSYRVRAADYLRDAPPTVVVWGALGVGVLVLLGLTIRLLRRPDDAEAQ